MWLNGGGRSVSRSARRVDLDVERVVAAAACSEACAGGFRAWNRLKAAAAAAASTRRCNTDCTQTCTVSLTELTDWICLNLLLQQTPSTSQSLLLLLCLYSLFSFSFTLFDSSGMRYISSKINRSHTRDTWICTRREFLRKILSKNTAIIAIQHSKMYFVDTFGDFSHTVE